MLRDVLEWDWIIGFMYGIVSTYMNRLTDSIPRRPYGEWWRRHRKVFHTYFNPKAIVAQYPVQRKAVHSLLRSLIDFPTKFEDHATRYAHLSTMLFSSTFCLRLCSFSGTVILESVYGYEVRAEKDPYVELVHKADEAFNKVAGSTFLVDVVPFRKLEHFFQVPART